MIAKNLSSKYSYFYGFGLFALFMAVLPQMLNSYWTAVFVSVGLATQSQGNQPHLSTSTG